MSINGKNGQSKENPSLCSKPVRGANQGTLDPVRKVKKGRKKGLT
jgi:hypothetical protein